MKKVLFVFLLSCFSFACFSFAQEDLPFEKGFCLDAAQLCQQEVSQENYLYFTKQGCPNCMKVKKFFDKKKILKTFPISVYDIEKDANVSLIFQTSLNALPNPPALGDVGVPLLMITSREGNLSYLMGASDIISYFQNYEKLYGDLPISATASEIKFSKEDLSDPLKFMGIMLPAALGDSINPCAFAVMLLLLSTILSKSKSRKKTLLSGLLFSGAIFLSYFLMGLGIFKLLANASVTHVFKWVVAGLGILVGLANLKDYFWYGKGFLMEVPLAWRPKMMKIIQKVVSPGGAFLVGILVSLFLLPCSAGPYVVILGYLKSQDQVLNYWGYFYLFFYNFIFILPMLVITILVSSNFTSVEALAKIKNKNTKLIHLIVGLLMLGLGLFVIYDMYM